MNRNKKRVMNTVALGLALLVTPTLTYRSAINAYAQAALTTDEEARIQAFLATQPQNNDTTSLGEVTVAQPTSTYTFPGINNYTSFFKSRGRRMALGEDYEYTIDSWDGNNGKRVKVKDWANVQGYLVNTMSDGSPEPESYEDRYLFVDEVTLINQDDGTEFTIKNAVLSIGNADGDRFFDTLLPNRPVFNLPVEEADPRFQPEVLESVPVAMFGNGYWTLHSTVTETVPYETIVKIDESLRHGEVEEVVAGSLGSLTANFDLTMEDLITGGDFSQYTSDVIYEDLKAIAATNPTVGDYIAKPWGTTMVAGFSSTAASNRELRVGIDYTHYVTEDGTELQPKVYGLQAVENFAGFEYVSTRTEANGDRVHVYKPVVAIPATPTTIPTQPAVPTAITGVVSTPVQTTPAVPVASTQVTETSVIQSTPKTGDTGLFASTFMLFTGMIGSIGAFITKKKNS